MSDQIRLSDAERETASAALGEHFAQGRLDPDEHAERHEQIWTARTRGDIPRVFADLPGGSPLHAVPRRTPPPTGPWTAPRAPQRRGGGFGGLPWPVKALLVVALVALVVTNWPLILIGLGVFWMLSHRGRTRREWGGGCRPSSRHWSTS